MTQGTHPLCRERRGRRGPGRDAAHVLPTDLRDVARGAAGAAGRRNELAVRICTFEQRGNLSAGVVAADGTIVSTVDILGGASDEDDVLDLLMSGEELVGRASQRGGPRARRHSAGERPSFTPRSHVRPATCSVWVELQRAFRRGEAGARPIRPAARAAGDPQFPSLFTKNPATVVGPERRSSFPRRTRSSSTGRPSSPSSSGKAAGTSRKRPAMSSVSLYVRRRRLGPRCERRHGGQWFKGRTSNAPADAVRGIVMPAIIRPIGSRDPAPA